MLRPVRFIPRAVVLCGVLSACGGGQPVEPGSPAPVPAPDSTAFSADRAWADLEMFSALGPRPAGSQAAEAARARIRTRLEEYGVAVEEVETLYSLEGAGPIALTHLIATLPGASSDRIVLIAPYDSGRYEEIEFVGANDGASGAAVLLEVARVLSLRERPYTVEIVWLEGEGRLGRGGEDEREQRWLGSRGLAERWANTGRLDDVRLLVDVNRVCDADLRIARDLRSQRAMREQFWTAARRLGRTESFPPRAEYESVESSHLPFRERGVRPVVAIADTAFGGDVPPGAYAESERDVPEQCAPESLESVGDVVVEAVVKIGDLLAKIDRFARTPARANPELPAEPEVEVEPEPPVQPDASAEPDADPSTTPRQAPHAVPNDAGEDADPGS